MLTVNRFGAGLVLFAALLLGACESGGYRADAPASGYGVVQSIELVKQEGIGGSGVGVGTLAGGVVGGVLGSQVGSGSGKTAATIGGVAAGAYIGHEIEKGRMGTGDVYKFTVRMDSGAYQTLTQSSSDNFKVGDRVRIENGTLVRP